jgi:excisionase family DNA binding protein
MVWTPEQTGAFLDFIAGDELYALWHLIAFGGLRRGEAINLRWSDTDLDKGTATSVRSHDDGDAWTPKSKSGARTISLDAGTVEALREHRKTQERTLHGEPGRVFTRGNGAALNPESVSQKFDRLIERYQKIRREHVEEGLTEEQLITLHFRTPRHAIHVAVSAPLPPIRMHNLRHVAASLYRLSGAPGSQARVRAHEPRRRAARAHRPEGDDRALHPPQRAREPADGRTAGLRVRTRPASGGHSMRRLHKPRKSSSIVFMANVSVAEAAKRLGVGVPRIHQRIADGSLRAERIGSQWVIDELSLLRIAERKKAGRPLSARSAWAIIAVAEGDDEVLEALAPAERSRAKARLSELLDLAAEPPRSEADVRGIASDLRLRFRNRADRVLRKAAAADLPKLREDPRWQSFMSPAVSGIASNDVDGYLAAPDLDPLSRAYLLMPAGEDSNVVIHVLPEGQKSYPDSKLLLAADLAEQRGAREELRAAELLREVAEERGAVKR